ncbi:uncharacterized protein LOC116018831 isoform X1 [Ipomoea triloba]|uniref:uncharacterized protein LOC116018831 isoform X1 n=1 Tax=Ipomoea triloba TaxID=35885 RepID=UPI00125DCEF7|nr:uncharacterized protein LOC116018831 isoform X1 [Ipomoea triloba]
MEPPFPPTSAATHSLVDAPPFPPPPAFATKLRLMCSYGGHIVPRPQTNTLFYAGGETRIIAVDRLTTAFSLASLTAHLSRTLYNNRPFLLKYQLPDEGLDSLISVTTDEDLQNMLEEHDRIASSISPNPSRIRLFLFPVKPESLGSGFLDPKAESWFSDALSNTRIERRVQSTDSNLPRALIGLDFAGGFDSVSGESLVLETSSSFGSTSSFISMSSLPAFGVHGEDGTANLQDKKVRVPSSASIESDNSVGSVASQPKPAICQDSFAQVSGMAPSCCTVEPESPMANPSTMIQPQKMVQVSAYEFPQQSDGKLYKPGMQYVHGGPYYVPQYPTTTSQLSSCYPLYHVPVLPQQQQQSPYHVNQPYPIYLVPVVPNQSLNMPMQCSVNDATDIASILPPLHLHGAVIPPPVLHKETLAAKHVPEPAANMQSNLPVSAAPASAPSTKGQQSFVGPLEPKPVGATSIDTVNYCNEFDDDLSYSQIYKTQPPAPSFISQCQTITKGATVQLSESSMQQTPNDVTAQVSSLLQQS